MTIKRIFVVTFLLGVLWIAYPANPGKAVDSHPDRSSELHSTPLTKNLGSLQPTSDSQSWILGSRDCQDYASDLKSIGSRNFYQGLEPTPCLSEFLKSQSITSCEGPTAPESECIQELRTTRSRLIAADLKPDARIEEIPTTILVNRFIGLGAPDSPEKMQEKLRIVRELLSRDPANPDSYKLMASLSFYQGDEAFYTHGRKWLEEGLRYSRPNENLEELYYYFSSKDPSVAYESLLQPGAHSSSEYYYAGRLLDSGRRQEAEAVLESLTKRYPENERYVTALKDLRGGDPDPILPFFKIDGME